MRVDEVRSAAPRHAAPDDVVPRLPRPRPDTAWPLAAVAVTALAGAVALRQPWRPGEGALATGGFLLLRSDAELPVPLASPDGVAAVHAGVYATVTRSLERHATLVGAGRELVLAAVLLTAVLLWWAARRWGLAAPAAAAAVALGVALPLAGPVPLPDTPAALAVPWTVLALALAGDRQRPLRALGAVAAALVAVLLAPDALLLLVAGTAAAVATGALLGGLRLQVRVAAALALAPVFLGVALLLGRWDPQPEPATALGLGRAGVVLLAAALLATAALAAWRLPRVRVPAVAVLATALAAVVPPARTSAVLLCVPLGALLAAALVQDLARRLTGRRRALRTPLAAVGGLALALGATAAGLALARTPSPDLGTADQEGLVAWAREELPRDAVVVTPTPLWAELVHAGGDARQLRRPGDDGTGPPSSPTAPVLAVVTAPDTGPAGAAPVAVFDAAGPAHRLTVVDPWAGTPTEVERASRRALAGALLANPRTATSGQATGRLVAAQIDPRLLILLAGVGSRLGLGVQALPPAPAEDGLGTDVRQAVLDSALGEPLEAGSPAAERLLTYLDAQQDPFRPDSVQFGDGTLLVRFRYVSAPDALVTATTG